MRAGKLRQRVNIQAPGLARDSVGSPGPGFTTIATVWAEVESLAGKEEFVNDQFSAQASHRVEIRYQRPAGHAINEKYRILWGSRSLDVLSAEDPENRKKKLVLLCLERKDLPLDAATKAA